ncbi:MAG TPA: type II toxin-antitoxin system VapC family toxin [Candidatus Udaeobacter sp.]|nr:type II toxin-antitoxin system VapC family toxin [Candidatus Udaeobacter sp.]
MTEILLDSDVIIGWLRGYHPFAELIPELVSKANLAWTSVSVAEIYAGVRRSEESRIDNLFLVLETVPLSAEIGKKAGNYLHAYSKSHGMELGDALIAATAHVQGLRLWTLNKKHYPMKDLEFYSAR